MIRKVFLLCAGLLVIGAASAHAFPPIDLTTLNATYTGADGVIWHEQITQPTGTGVYNPFLRVQATHTEQGFNTNYGGPSDPVGSHHAPLDDKTGIWTHSLTVGDLVTRTVGGINYYVFRCDVNEPASVPANYLSLDYLRIYTSSNAGASMFSTLANVAAHSTLRYDMDASGLGNQTVYLNANLKPGSGTDDFEVLIPTSKFTGAALTDNLILYSGFGYTGGAWGADFESGAGFEEWAAITRPTTPPPSVPEPTTALLLGSGALGLLGAVRRRK